MQEQQHFVPRIYRISTLNRPKRAGWSMMSHIRVNTSNAKVRHIDGAELVQSFFGNPSRGIPWAAAHSKKNLSKQTFLSLSLSLSLSFLKADVVFTI